MLQEIFTVTWYPKLFPLSLNRFLFSVLTVTLRPTGALDHSPEEANIPGLGKLSSALEGLCRAVYSPGKEARRIYHDLVGVLNILRIPQR